MKGLGRTCAMLLAGAGSCLFSVSAQAQDVRERNSDYVSNVTARERERAEATATQLGAFLVSPQISGDAMYDDNVYATKNDRRGDVIFTVRPELYVRSTWSRHSLAARGYFERQMYAKYTRENASNYGIDLDGRFDISGQTRALLSVAADKLSEDRGSLSSFSNAPQRVREANFDLRAGLEQDLGNLKLSGEGRVRRTTYDDVDLGNGISLDQSFRDLTLASGSLQLGYNLNEATEFLVRGTYESRKYDVRAGDPNFNPATDVDRSGESFLIEGGIQREVSRLILATVRIGYLDFRYPDPRLQDINAFSYYANVRWNLTPLTTVNFTAQRSVDETSSPYTAGNLRDEVALAMDHELLRTLYVSLSGRFGWINPQLAAGIPLNVIANDSREQTVLFQTRYYVGRHLRVQGQYRYRARQSDDPFIAYRSNEITFGLNYAF